MKSLVIFDDSRCIELAPDVLPSALPCQDVGLDSETLLSEQLEPNVMTKFKGDLNILFADIAENSFSILQTDPVRIGSSKRDHIVLHDTSANVAIYENKLLVLDASDVYLNGRKIGCGEFSASLGDAIWVGSCNIIIHDGYITCAGTQYSSSLNISLHTPEVYEDFPVYKRSPRIIKREPSGTVDLVAPRTKEERKKGELVKIIIPPLMMMVVTVAIGILMGRGLIMLASAAAMLVSLVFSITTFISDAKTHREKEQERVTDYDHYLLNQRKKLHKLYELQRDSLLYHNLSPIEIEREIQFYSSRLYERAANDSDFLTLSLGYSDITASFKVKFPEETIKDALYDEMIGIAKSYQIIPNMPTVIDLKCAHLGLVGEKAYIHRQLVSIISQLCFFQSYHDIEIVILVEKGDRPKFEWVRWYPHFRVKTINVVGLISADNQRDQVLGNITQILKSRRQKQEDEKKDSSYLPHYIFIIDNPKLIINNSIMEYLQTPKTTLGFSIIYTTNIRANLPENIKTVFLLNSREHGTLLMNEGHLVNRSVTLYATDSISLEMMSRRLAPLVHNQGISTQIPESVTFFEMFGVKRPDELPVLELWEKNACHKSLAVPLGLRGKNDIVTLNLHEKAHGPHGLVAGTTGSGKSEIIQSYILSLAVNFHPHEVGFLLIDYKGGGMANLFANLPHLLGTITNLDGSESMRALASIKSELARRQRIFSDCGVNNINQYTKLFRAGEVTLPLPHLFIISDEFAELKKEQPDFMSELVSAARIGRSLGVHLILATQKPSGVVDDQIWSNSKFKLALKVANESDSNEVLKTPDAARLTQAGRAYLQVGNNEIYELFQSAWSGASFSEEIVEYGFDSRVYLINHLGQGELLNDDLSTVDKGQDSKHTQLDVTVEHIRELYDSLNTIPVEKPWLPSLQNRIVTPHLLIGIDVGKADTYDLAVPIGVVDIPEEQLQKEYIHSFVDDGNLAVFGASGFGKSTVAMTTLLTLASRNSPKLLNIFILDYGNSALAQLRVLPHTADYLGFDDTEKLSKLTKHFAEELKKRKHLFASVNAMNFKMYNEVASEKLPAILFVIDNYDVVREVDPDLEEFLVKLTRDGTGVGIFTIVTASRSNAVRYSVLNNFKNKLALFMFEASDITAVAGRCAYKLPEVRGRALVKLQDTHVAQCYLPVKDEDDIAYTTHIGEIIADISTNNSAPKAIGVRMVSETVTYAELVPYLRTMERLAVLGFDTESTDPTYLDLSIGCQMIIGGPSTGKTNVLRILLTQFKDNMCFVADSRAGDLHEFDGRENVIYMDTESRLDDFYQALYSEVERRKIALHESGLRTREFCSIQPPVLVAIDDGDNFVELCKTKTRDMEQLIPAAIELGFSFVIATLASKMRGFDNLTKVLKDTQAGLVLGNPTEQNLLPVIPPRGYKAAIDIAFWYKRGDVRQIKIPYMH